MPAVKIRVGGKTADDKPAAKPAAKRRGAAKPAKAPAKRPAKRAAAPKSERAKPASNDAPVRRASKGIDARTEAKLLKVVEKAGERRTKAEIEHKESINALHDAAREAIAGGVSMAKVADASGISRQWLYKMGEFGDREGVTSGNGKSADKPKPAGQQRTERPAKRPAARRTTTAKAPARRTASTTRTRIRSRA